ncbi:MAG: hypothetical protein ABI203_04330 [Mucilaginibacter sp.]
MITIYLLHNFAYGQQVLTVKGVVFKKNSSERLAKVLITNLNSHAVMISNDLGVFTIKGVIGDTLLVSKFEYAPQKRIVINADDLPVYMQPVIELNGVTIKDQTKKQELNEVMKQYHSQGIFNDGNSLPFWQFVNSPLTGLYNLFGKGPADARRFAAFSKNEQEATAVDSRYTKELVKSITKLPDDEVIKFMQIFTPSFEDIKQWNDYQLISYIKKSFTYYQKNKDRPQPKLQKLY